MNTPYVPWRTRHGIPIITTPVADVSDAERFPNIVAAIDHARELRKAGAK